MRTTLLYANTVLAICLCCPCSTRVAFLSRPHQRYSACRSNAPIFWQGRGTPVLLLWIRMDTVWVSIYVPTYSVYEPPGQKTPACDPPRTVSKQGPKSRKKATSSRNSLKG